MEFWGVFKSTKYNWVLLFCCCYFSGVGGGCLCVCKTSRPYFSGDLKSWEVLWQMYPCRSNGYSHWCSVLLVQPWCQPACSGWVLKDISILKAVKLALTSSSHSPIFSLSTGKTSWKTAGMANTGFILNVNSSSSLEVNA